MYDGSASKFHEWSFRASMRWASAKDDDKPKMMNIVIEGLRGEAALVAMDLGKDVAAGHLSQAQSDRKKKNSLMSKNSTLGLPHKRSGD